MARKYPIGAEVHDDGTSFRVFAPLCHRADVALETGQKKRFFKLESEGDGYFQGFFKEIGKGDLYRYRLNSKKELYPDPASRYQPKGPLGPSQVVDLSSFNWKDQKWQGPTMGNQIIYEMHIGTFTKQGTLKAAQKELKELAKLGITMIELMPVNEFHGQFGWGYDGVNLFAPTHLYGTPEDLCAFINAAHTLKISVVLDVVYNHFGPDGSFIHYFSNDYFNETSNNDWGTGINFDHPCSREFFLTNAKYWIEEYHFDGLRLDATQAIDSTVPPPILQHIGDVVHTTSPRKTVIIAENEPQLSIIARDKEKGGYGLDALWNDDFHHSAIVKLTGRREAYYQDYKGSAQELISCMKYGFLFQGQFYVWQNKRRGTPGLDLSPKSFITFLQNHDQIANSGKGYRIDKLTNLGNYKAMTTLLFMGPNVPMLFQGQEFASSNPFLYFADHKQELDTLIDRGRKEFLAQFPHLKDKKAQDKMFYPSNKNAFLKSKLNFKERKTHAPIYKLHKDLITLRKKFIVPNLENLHFDGAVFSEDVFLLRYFLSDADLLILFNFGSQYFLNPESEPLLAPPLKHPWKVLLHTEDVDYEGQGVPSYSTKTWTLPPHSAFILKGE